MNSFTATVQDFWQQMPITYFCGTRLDDRFFSNEIKDSIMSFSQKHY